MDEPIEQFEHAGNTVKIYPDFDPLDPRGDDNLGVMVCFHRRYNLGDKHDFASPADFGMFLKTEKPPVVLPLYLYDHSIQSISTRSFVGRAHHAEWDSGQVGYIYTDKERMADFLGVKRLTKAAIERVEKALEAEVETYDQYLRGDVYGYVVKGLQGRARWLLLGVLRSGLLPRTGERGGRGR